jgi:hypothetical protein
MSRMETAPNAPNPPGTVKKPTVVKLQPGDRIKLGTLTMTVTDAGGLRLELPPSEAELPALAVWRTPRRPV